MARSSWGWLPAVLRVKVRRKAGAVPLKSKVAVPPTLCFSMSSEAWVFVKVQVGAVAGVDDRPHGGVAGVEAGAARRGEASAAAGADRDDRRRWRCRRCS